MCPFNYTIDIKRLDKLATGIDDPEIWLTESTMVWGDIKKELLAGRNLAKKLERFDFIRSAGIKNLLRLYRKAL
jgi:hypothetical protein